MPARRENAPDLAHQRGRVIRNLEGMHEQDPIEHRIAQRQLGALDEAHRREQPRWPGGDTLPGRHEGDGAFRALAQRIEIGRRIAEAEQGQPAEILPALADLAQDHLPRDGAERAAIEGFQIDDIELHGYEWTLPERSSFARAGRACR